jgi:hypothetical protein
MSTRFTLIDTGEAIFYLLEDESGIYITEDGDNLIQE